jgi:hypothetical protein
VIAVMTTELPSKELGRTFIHKVSRMAYEGEVRYARWRSVMGISPAFTPLASRQSDSASPDVPYWNDDGPPKR